MNTRAGKTEERILRAAMQVFEEKGMSGTRMQEIADRAGVNKAMLHYYYRNKERLFNAVFDQLAANMFEKILSCFNSELPFSEKVKLFYQHHISFLQANPGLPAFVLNEINQNPDRLIRILQNSGFDRTQSNLFKDLEIEMQSGNMRRMAPMQLVVNILALSIFPFAARGLLEILLKKQGLNWTDFINNRKSSCPEFVINAMEHK